MNKFKIVLIVLLLIALGLAVAIIVPGLVKPRSHPATSACVANLKYIQEAKRFWAEANQSRPGDVPSESDLFGPEKRFREMPLCPASGIYTPGPVGQNPTCSIGPPAHTLDYKKYQRSD